MLTISWNVLYVFMSLAGSFRFKTKFCLCTVDIIESSVSSTESLIVYLFRDQLILLSVSVR